MTTMPLWQKLKHLVSLDEQLDSCIQQIKQAELKLQELRTLPQTLQETLTLNHQARLAAQKNVDLQELNAKDLKSREDQKRKALDSIKNQKEFASLSKEIDDLIKQLAEQDDIVMKAWHQNELAQKKEETDAVAVQAKIDAINKEIDDREAELDRVEETLENKKVEREEYLKEIPAEWLERYEQMHKRVQNPIVAAVNGSCSACYYAIPPQDFARLKRSALLPCRSCYRLLYFDQGEETATKTETF